MFPYTAVDATVLDTLFQADGTQLLKAAGRTIDTTDVDAPIDVAPHLVEDATLFAGHGYKPIATTGVAVALRGSATPCEAFTFGVDDVAKVFINGTSGDGASFAYEQ
jgi:hypothetical protein